MELPVSELPVTELAIRAINRAPALARQGGHREVSSAHLLLATLECEADADSRFGQILAWGGFKRDELTLYARAWQGEHASDGETPGEAELPLGNDFTTALQWAANEANFAMNALVGPEHLFLALVRAQRGDHVGEVLRPLGRDLNELRSALRSMNAPLRAQASGHPLAMLGASGEAALEAAHRAMRATFCGRIGTPHLLLGVLGSENSDTGARAVGAEILGAAGVDVADLRLQARAAIASDGTVATSEKRFDVGAKRALERAKREAQARGQGGHILVGLLPHRVTMRERRMFGMSVADPLESVWNRVLADVDEEGLQRALETLGAPPAFPASPVEVAAPAIAAEGIRLDWRWVTFGIAWWSWALLEQAPGVRLSMLAGAFGVGALGAAFGDSIGGRVLTNRASSFVVGMSLGIGVLFFIGGILVTRR